MEVKKCFADNGEICTALNEKECKNCKFYRTDITKLDIEREIKNMEERAKNEM